MLTMARAREVVCDADHIYRRIDDGVIVPGFSEIKEDIGFPKNKYWTPEGRAEGEALHWWFNFLARGKVAQDPPHADIAGRVEGIKKFIVEARFKLIGGEAPLYSDRNNFACTPDGWGLLDGINSLVEVKRGAKLKEHRLQTAAQKIVLAENGFDARRRYALYLKNGGYSLERHSDTRSIRDWIGMAKTYHDKRIYL